MAQQSVDYEAILDRFIQAATIDERDLDLTLATHSMMGIDLPTKEFILWINELIQKWSVNERSVSVSYRAGYVGEIVIVRMRDGPPLLSFLIIYKIFPHHDGFRHSIQIKNGYFGRRRRLPEEKQRALRQELTQYILDYGAAINVKNWADKLYLSSDRGDLYNIWEAPTE